MKKTAVVGLGYVGLPLALRLSQSNFFVNAIDINIDKINSLKKGILPFAQNEPNLESYLKREIKRRNIKFISSFEPVQYCSYIFICVDTPVLNKKPNYTALKSAIRNVGSFLTKGSTVIIESTVAPNTTKNLVTPLLEKQSNLKVNKDFFVATVPERIRPNHIFEQLTTLSRVIGVSDKKIEAPLKKVYSQITSGEIDFTDLTTAETVKTVENSLRDVNIAFANEIAIACEEIGVNVWEVRELVNKSPFHNMLEPGAGVGGHCIPKDPWLLMSSVNKNQMKMTKCARNINSNMPSYIYELIREALKEKGKNIKNSNLAILGYSYVENSDDTRNSPTQTLIEILKNNNVEFKIHDPEVKEYSKILLYQTLEKSDCLILMVSHSQYKKLNLSKVANIMRTKIIIDGRNFINKDQVLSQGFLYKGVGNTKQ